MYPHPIPIDEMDALLIERGDAARLQAQVDSDAETLPLDAGDESERLMQSGDEMAQNVSDAETEYEPLSSEEEMEEENDEQEDGNGEQEDNVEDNEMNNQMNNQMNNAGNVEDNNEYQGDNEEDEVKDDGPIRYVLMYGEDDCTKCPRCKNALNLKDGNASINVVDFSYIVNCSGCLKRIHIRNMISDRQKSLLQSS